MKFWIKITTADKIALWIAGAVVYTIGILPATLGGWILYHYREKLKSFILLKEVQDKFNSVISYFK